MTLYVDVQYLQRLQHMLPLFKQKTNKLYNCRCILCGDSKIKKNKARGFFFEKAGKMFYTCHNCGASMSLGNFIKEVDHAIYAEYQFEKYKEKTNGSVIRIGDDGSGCIVDNKLLHDIVPVLRPGICYSGISSVADLVGGHPVRAWLNKRCLPENLFKNFHYAKNFEEFCSIYNESFKDAKTKTPRLIIPFYDESGISRVFQCRAFDKALPKYITIKQSEDDVKVYGLDKVNKQETVYVVEGPIDSMLVDNSIAVCSSSLMKTFYSYNLGIKEKVFVWDNDPRNKEIITALGKAIDANEKVVIWPPHVKEKDPNDMLIAGNDLEYINHLIKNNVYSGLTAKIKFNEWKKL